MRVRLTLVWLVVGITAFLLIRHWLDEGAPLAPAVPPRSSHGEPDGSSRSAVVREPGTRRETQATRPNADARDDNAEFHAPASLRIRATWDDGSSARGVGVLVVEPRAGRADPVHRASTEEGGLAVFTGLPATVHVIRIRSAEPKRVELVAGETIEVAFTVARGEGIEGRVIDALGSPVLGATLWLTPPGIQVDQARAVPVGLSGDAGRFRVEGVSLPVNSWLAARAPGHGASAWRLVVALSADHVPVTLRGVELRLGAARASITGVCLGPDDVPVANVAVHIAPIGIAREHDGDVQLWSAHEYYASTDGDGGFRFDDLATGSWLLAAHADGLWFEPREVVIDSALAVVRVELIGQPAASIAGTVTDQRQTPVSGAFVRVRGIETPRAKTGADGEFRIHELPSRRVALLSFADGFADDERELELRGGATTELRIELAREPKLFGVARSSSGASLARWQISAIPVGWVGGIGGVRIGEDGAFTLAVGNREPHVFCIASPGSPFHVVLNELGTFMPSEEPIELIVPDQAFADSALTGSLPPSDGDRQYLLGVRDPERQTRATFGDSTLDRQTGRFRVGPLPAGVYWLQVQLRERRPGTWGVPVAGTLLLGPYQLIRGQTLELGSLELTTPGRLECVLTPKAGCEPKNAQLQWDAVDRRSWGLLNIGAELAGSWSIVPGEYDVTIWGEGFLSIERRVTVLAPPGAATRLELTLEPGQRLPIELALPSGETRATFVVRDPTGRIAYQDEFGDDEARVVTRWPVIGRGRHDVEILGASGRRFSGTFVVESLTATQKPLRFEVRRAR